MTDIHNLHNKLSETTNSLTAIRQRRSDLLTELDSLATQEAELNTKATSLTAELLRLEPPAPRPQDIERLAGLTQTLHAKLRKLPDRSPTAAQVRGQLERLDDESAPVSDRLSLAKSLLDDVANCYLRDRAVWDEREGANAARLR